MKTSSTDKEQAEQTELREPLDHQQQEEEQQAPVKRRDSQESVGGNWSKQSLAGSKAAASSPKNVAKKKAPPAGSLQFLRPKPKGGNKRIPPGYAIATTATTTATKDEENEEEIIFAAYITSTVASRRQNPDNQPGAYSGVPGEPLQRIPRLSYTSTTMGGGRLLSGEDEDDVSNSSSNNEEVNNSELEQESTLQSANVGLVEALPVDTTRLPLSQADEVDRTRNKSSAWKMYAFVFVIGAAIVGISLTVVLILKDNSAKNIDSPKGVVESNPSAASLAQLTDVPTISPSPTTSPSPTIDDASIYCSSVGTDDCDILPLVLGYNDEFLPPEGPQIRAYNFLSVDPLLRNYTGARIRQRFALATFYYATNGPFWTYTDWLNYDQHECTWYSRNSFAGTTFGSEGLSPCNSEGEYEELWQWKNGLEGTLPTELFLLTALRSIDLQSQQIIGSVPSELGLCTLLEQLSLSGNQLQSIIPSEIGKLTVLELLDVSRNNFVGAVPSELGDLTAMTRLTTFRNELEGTFPDSICELHNLTAVVVDCDESVCPMNCSCECYSVPLAMDEEGSGAAAPVLSLFLLLVGVSFTSTPLTWT